MRKRETETESEGDRRGVEWGKGKRTKKREKSKRELFERMLIQCRKMIEYAHFLFPNGNLVKDHEWMIKLLVKKTLLELEYSHMFKSHTVLTNFKEDNIQWRDLAPPRLSGQIYYHWLWDKLVLYALWCDKKHTVFSSLVQMDHLKIIMKERLTNPVSGHFKR